MCGTEIAPRCRIVSYGFFPHRDVRIFRDAGEVLQVDERERERWANVRANLAPYPKAEGLFGEVWLDVQNAPTEHVYNIPVTLAPVFQVGSLWLSRRFSTPPYSANESLRATTLSPGLDLEVSPAEALRLGLRLEVPLFAAELGGPRHVHAALQAGGRVGWVF